MLAEDWQRLRLSPRLTLLLLAAVFAVNIYRAATQGITVDEAFTYRNFVAPPWAQVMTTYDVNHHVLNSLLSKLTTGLFGLSELTLRMPSLAGGLIYLIAVRAIVLDVFSGGWSLAAFALLSLNPFVLDYLSAARGYGLALGFLVAALWFLVHRDWYRAGILLGLTAGANLSFLYPIAGLLGMLALVDANRKNIGTLLDRVVVPLVVLPFVLYVAPVSHAVIQQFAYSPPTLLASFREFIDLTFARNRIPCPSWVPLAAELLALLILAGSTAACVVIRRSMTQTRLERLILLNGGAMVLCLAITWLAHITLHAGYPYSRTGVYWPVMLTLGGVALVSRFGRVRVLNWPAWALATLCLAAFLGEFETGYYEEWRFDAASKRIAALIYEKAGPGPVRIACSTNLQHSLIFYRDLHHYKWEISGVPQQAADFHVLIKKEFRPDLKLLYRDPVAESVVMQ